MTFNEQNVTEEPADLDLNLVVEPSDLNLNDLNVEVEAEPSVDTQTQSAKPSAQPDVVAPQKQTQSGITQRERELFKKFHNSDFNSNSSLDRSKLEQLRQAAQKVGDGDESKLRSTVYNIQYSGKPAPTRANRPIQQQAQTPKQQAAVAPASQPGGPTYYVRISAGRYRPAVQADISSNQPLFMRNPNPVLRAMGRPYVQVDRRPVRRASPA
jgi:hypothetical protein